MAIWTTTPSGWPRELTAEEALKRRAAEEAYEKQEG